MEYEIDPEPTAAERAALIAALERLDAEEHAPESAWWRAGVRENVDADA